MINRKIAIIGAGNLGSSLAKGLIRKNAVKPENITLTNINMDLLKELQNELGVNVSTDNIETVKKSDLVFVAVKPQVAPKVYAEIKEPMSDGKSLLISMVSGINLNDIKAITGDIPVARAMPNTAMSVLQSMTAVVFDGQEGDYHQDVIEIFENLGEVFTIPESQMAAATVLASCGIAFALRFMRAASMGGIEIGFNSQLSHKIASQIMLGAAELIKDTGHHPEREIDKVTTPMGVTISGLNEMEFQGFSASAVQGIRKAFHKISKIEEND